MIMLSYMVPVEEKPPPVPGKDRLALDFLQAPGSPEIPPRRKTNMSKDSSSSSFQSDLTVSSSTPTAHDKPKHKLLGNGNKHTALKRVSFGSSKGSMVETLIFESPLQEEPESSPPPRVHETTFPYNSQPPPPLPEDDSERSKVRVSFFVGAQAQCVSPPPAPPSPPPVPLYAPCEDMADHHAYNRQVSTESGWDNPFRPDGDLSREADEIVSLIKGGKPITPTPPSAQPQLSHDELDETLHATHISGTESAAPKATSPQKTVNGTKNGAAQIEVQKSPEPQQPEHVTIKKKPKCECCVLQ